MDKLSAKKRSWNMSRIKNRDTKPELQVRSLLHKLGYRFRVNRKDLMGCPDIVLPKYHKIILVNGCFWHRHENCKYAYIPKSKNEFRNTKFERNVARDKEVIAILTQAGWDVHIIWECETKNISILEKCIKNIFAQKQQHLFAM